MRVLRSEGLIVTGRDGSRVRPAKVRETLYLCEGEVDVRMPTMLERKEYDIDEGVPVLIVKCDSGDQILPADKFKIRVGVRDQS